jgi:hypothetical protein
LTNSLHAVSWAIPSADFRAGCSAQSFRLIATAANREQHPDLLERYGLTVTVSVGGSAIG